MFKFLKKEMFKVVSPLSGKCINIKDVPDEVFSTKMMGDGFAIIPDENVVVAPISGTVESIFPTVGIKSKEGVEVIVHIGLNTVELNGDGFETLVSQGTKIKAGTPMIRYDLEKLKEKGYNVESGEILIQ